MKKILLFILMFFSLTMSAQKDVTKFLGIPVDGYVADMKKKLIAKGFTYNAQYKVFEGEFNGRDVNVYIATNNNKVWRIMVCDKTPCGETDIKIRFNNLCRQFAKNKKYIPTNMGESDYTIPENEDISYKMIVDKKRYEASYYQISDHSSIDTLALQNKVREAFLKEFSQEEIDNPTEKQREKMISIISSVVTNDTFDSMKNKLVWFIISETYGEYFITMFYDNEYNHSDGEDL